MKKIEASKKKRPISKHGRLAAILVPDDQMAQATVEIAIRELRTLRSGLKLDGLFWKDPRDEGR